MSDIEIGTAEKMPRVIEAAYLSPDVALIGGIEETRIVQGTHSVDSMWQKTLDVYTCLREPTYDPAKLNEAMRGIVEGKVEPTMEDSFYSHGGDTLSLGKLYFDDIIGSLSVSTSVLLKPHLEAFEPGEVNPWDYGSTRDLKNRTWLRVFPDRESLAKVFTEGSPAYQIEVPRPRRKLFGARKPKTVDDPTKDPKVQQALNSKTIDRVISDLEYTH